MRKVLGAVGTLNLNAADLRERVAILKERAKLVLKETKRGQGNPVFAAARKQADLAHKKKGQITARRVLPIIKTLRAEGFETFQKLADELNRRKVPPPKADQWSASSVFVIERRGRK
jgi:hypothetical protein